MTTKRQKEEAIEAEIVGEEVKSCCSEGARSDRGGVFWGLLLVAVGTILIADTFVDVNLWQYFWPGALIVLGLSFVIRSFRG